MMTNMTDLVAGIAFLATAQAADQANDIATGAGVPVLEALLSSHIDLLTLMLVLGFGLWGAFSGAIRQVSNIAAVVIGYFSAGPLAAKMAPTFSGWLGAPLFPTTVACCIVAFFAVYFSSYVVVRMVLKRLVPEGENGFINRSLGFALGGAKAAAIVFVVLSAVALIEPAMKESWDRFAHEAKTSHAYRFSRENSIFAKMTQFQTLQTVMMASGPRSDPRTMSALEQLAGDPDLKELAKNPKIAALAADDDVQRALFSGNYARLFANDGVRELLNDHDLFDELGRVRGVVLVQAPAVDEEIDRPVKEKPVFTEGKAHGGSRTSDIDSL